MAILRQFEHTTLARLLGSGFIVFSVIAMVSGCSLRTSSVISEINNDVATNNAVNSELSASAMVDPAVLNDEHKRQVAPQHIARQHSMLVAQACQYDDLWVRAQSSFGLDLSSDDKRVDTHYRRYKKHGAYITRVSLRADRYLHHILLELKKRDMPTEIMLLPIVESAFDPFAYSHGRASGMWQFIPSTGKLYGLKQNWWYDGRRDIVASTAAALDYLQMLSKHYKGDWLLALAAYNSGIGTVNRAIRYNKKLGLKTDFFHLNLPAETRAYVPKLMALAKLVKEPEFGRRYFAPIPNTPYFEAIDTGSQIDLALVSELSKTDIEEIYRLNPGFNRWATDPQGPHRILVPVAKASSFRAELAVLSATQRVTWKRYTVKRNDNLGDLAQRFNTSMDAIQTANELSGNIIRTGDALLIPVASTSLENYSLSADLRRKKIQSNRAGKTNRIKQYYEVRAGDSFWIIAQKYNVGVSELTRWNSVAPKDVLMPGTRLVVWPKKQRSKSDRLGGRSGKSLTRKIYYPVRNGDSIAKIASRFKVKTSDVIRWNELQRKKYIHAGDRLVLYVDVSRTSI
ncbi:MAG: LysM peptidoglycan-binding domain-containing protein [Pseudomonadales bacterium]|nr:LysM peptidoglycan-binding domain-containing protein [Pseudomonadales bacterium]